MAINFKDLRYVDCDDTAGVLATDENGIFHGWKFLKDTWIKSEAIEMSGECRLIGRVVFDKLYPDIGLPDELASLKQ